MNALVGYRGNSLGNLSVTREQQLNANKNIASSFLAKITGTSSKSVESKQATTAETKQTANTSTTRTTDPASNELGRDAFLQLLVLELQNQDPLEPVDNSDMIAQLAQFSSLEGIEKLNSNFELLTGNVDQLNFISAQGLIGKFVEGINDSNEVVTGEVNSVYLDGSIVVLNVDGEIVPMSSVLSISNDALDDAENAETGEEDASNSEKRGPIEKIGDSINNFLDRF